jgi:transposase
MTYCKECLNKQQKINDLEEEIVSLKSRLHHQERTAKEGFFGSSTPSSKIPVKPNSRKEHPRNRGGAKPAHKGHGRTSISEEEADKVEKIPIGNVCPDCGSPLEDKGTKTRTVIDCQPVKMKKIVYHLQRKRCPKCKKLISAKPPGVLAKCLYSNQLLAYVAVQHYIYGNTLGRIEKQASVTAALLMQCTSFQKD